MSKKSSKNKKSVESSNPINAVASPENYENNTDFQLAKSVDLKSIPFFLPYQIRWLNDNSRIKIWEKSRRIGATYVQSYEDVFDALYTKVRGKVMDVWFSSADITAAKEYICYCEQWAKMFNTAVKNLGEIVIDEKKDIKALSIEFINGARINALSSNPTQFRSKGGKVVLDEFAFHSDQTALWKAAKPCITWGYPLRILSTHNGQNCLYYRFIKRCNLGKLDWGHHKTPIHLAVKEGLVDKIYGRPTTIEEQEQWLENEKNDCADDYTWQQEYCCEAVDEATAFLTYEMLNSIKEPNILKTFDNLTGELYLGYDVARRKDLSVITILEKLNSIKFLRHKLVLKKMRFRDQKAILYRFLDLPNLRRADIDSTGIGAQLAEDAQIDYGMNKVECFNFTNASKNEIAYQLYSAVQDKNLRIDSDTEDVDIEDYHSVRKYVTKAGNIRFDDDGSSDAHADRFMSLALANHAATDKNGFQKPIVYSAKQRRNNGFSSGLNLRGFRSDLRGLDI